MMMNYKFKIISYLFIFLLITSCDKAHEINTNFARSNQQSSSSQDPSEGGCDNVLSLLIDNKFTSSQKEIIDNMFKKYESIRFDSSYELYRTFFGGDSIDYLTNFLKKRIKYYKYQSEEELQEIYGPNASGIGASYSVEWLIPMCDSRVPVTKVEINGKTIKIDRPRHGVVFSGPYFFNSTVTPMERIALFTHEARHADCPVKPTNYSIACLLLMDPSQLDDNLKQCGFPHAKCSEQDNVMACEDIPWGSYAVTYIILKKFYHDCLSCTEVEKQLSNVAANSYANRFFVDPFSGTPNLSSFDE